MTRNGQNPYSTLIPPLSHAEIEEALAYREPEPIGAPRAAPLAERPLPDWPDVVSSAAYDFIITWETGGRPYYEQVIEGRPIWPGFASGITIGCGYDLGYHTAAAFSADWSDRIPAAAVTRLGGAIGFKTVEPGRAAKVARARELVRVFADIVVSWEVAVGQFDESKMPALVSQLEHALPNLDKLHPHCYGALLSLVFNRGTPFQNPAPRYVEMVEIHRLMSAGTRAAFGLIPDQLRSMVRIWGTNSSLAKRRRGEADLFTLGLRESELVAGLQVVTREAAEASGRESHDSVNVAPSDAPAPDPVVEEAALADVRFVPEATGLTAAHVTWNPRDDEQPDYRHLNTQLAGTAFTLTPADLDLLIACNAFRLVRDGGGESPLVIFALRGAKLFGGPSQLRQPSLTLQDQRPDHRDFRCVIGVYDRAHQTLSAFQASTVPNAHFVALCHTKANAGTDLAELTGNILPTGCYTYTVGTHKPDQAGEIRGALRLSKTTSGADIVVVLRSLEDVTYDRMDRWHKCTPADNIHPGQLSLGFSSAGCLTLPGSFRNGEHAGRWSEFRDALELGGADDGKQFSCVLLTGLDAAITAKLRRDGGTISDPTVREHLVRLRHGSAGAAVAALQAALGLNPDPSQLFGPVTREALTKRQQNALGWADGIYSPDMERQLRLGAL
jgi:hypothetical protein